MSPLRNTLTCWLAIAMLFSGLSLSAQRIVSKGPIDSLDGFDMAGALEHAAEMKTSTEKNFFLEHAKRTYKIQKYDLYNWKKDEAIANTNLKTYQGPQPGGCGNIDFEMGDTSTWAVTGDFQVMSGGVDPYGGFPRVYPGGTNSLRLNDDNITGKTKFQASATRIIPVTTLNNQFQLHFAFCLLNFPHAANAAALFKVQFFDASNNLISCPSYSCYYSNPPGALSGLPAGVAQTSSVTGKNIGNQTYPVTYVPWQTVSMDLSAYNGQNVKVVINCNWCIYNYDWGYCYIDADCGSNTFLPTGVGCGGSLCGPPGMLSYTWTPPVGAATTNSCITATGPGIYTLQCTPYLSCAPPVTYTVSAGSSAPTITLTSAQPNCLTSVASASATTSGAATSSGYTVSWSPSPGTVTPITGGSSASGLAYGNNTVTVTDVNGCKSSATFSINSPPPLTTFSLNYGGGTSTLTCTNPTVNLTGVNTSTSPLVTNVTYTWSPGNFVGNPYTVNAPGVYTVTGQDNAAGSCPFTTTIAVSQFTTVPSVAVSSPTFVLTCNGAPATFTATASPTLNVMGQWFAPGPVGIGSVSASPLLLSTSNPGTYTVAFTNIANGCIATQTVQVTANIIVPSMTVNSLNGNTITCNNPCLTMNITASAGPAPKTYSWTNQTTSVTTTPASGGYTICAPGNYLAEYMDGNNCRVAQLVTISIDTTRPAPTAITNLPSNSFTLNCYHPVLTATAVSNPLLPATNYSWTQPPNLTVSSNTMNVATASVTANPTTFTVLAQGSNGCVGRQKVFFYKDVTVPAYTAVFTPSAITCTNLLVAMSPNYVSGPAGPTNFTFTSPPPTTTANSSGAQFGIPGTYTMTYQYLANGCTGTTNTVVPLNVTPPATVPITPTVIPCGSPTTQLIAGTTSQPNYYSYTWQPPVGAGLSCASCYSTTTNMTGNYFVTITNTINGCIATNSVSVSTGSLDVSLTADPQSGFAPLPVSFTNNTSLGSASAGTITTTWSYGNGISNTYTNTSAGGSPNGSTIYQSAGTYTVLLVVQQQSSNGGGCSGTATTVVTVDLPSAIEIPNVFTPNGDGVNDFFTLQSTNLGNITCVIFDRWGVKMYDVNSDKGNISWDGKNLSGKEVPAGIYFFLLKATGKDGQVYEKQGTVTIYR